MSGPEESSSNSPIISRLSLNPLTGDFFPCAPGQVSLYASGSVISLPTAGKCWVVSVSPSLLQFFMWSFYPSLCSRCSLGLFFLRMNCSVCRCRFHVYVGGDGLGLSLLCHLGPSPLKSILNSWSVSLVRMPGKQILRQI